MAEQYLADLTCHLEERYRIRPVSITPAKRGYYGETWKVQGEEGCYFVKLDFLPRHREIFRNSLAAVDYFCRCGIDFAGQVVKTVRGELSSEFRSAVMGVFRWVEGENLETDDTKPMEYRLLCQIYRLTRPGLPIPTMEFSDGAARQFYRGWRRMEENPNGEGERAFLAMLDGQRAKIDSCARKLSRYANACRMDTGGFVITHGDAGGNFFVGDSKTYILDWDEVMYAPPERDAWVMCCRGWARELFEKTLRENGLPYRLRPERLAFLCFHMYFFYLGEFLADIPSRDVLAKAEDFMTNGWIEERLEIAETL